MEVIFFQSEMRAPVRALTTPEGKIDFAVLGEEFGLEPKTIKLCGFGVPQRDDESKAPWTQLRQVLNVSGTEEDPVMVSGRPVIPARTVDAVGGEETALRLKEIEKMVLGGEETALRLKEIEKMVRELVPVQNRRKVRISEVSSSEWAQVQVDGGLKLEAFVPSTSRPVVTYKPHKPWEVFHWDGNLTERQQVAQYIQHLCDFVDVKSSNCAFADVVADKHFLDFPAFEREFVGTADVAIAPKSSVGLAIPGNGLRCIIELKKHLGDSMNSAPGYQAIISLLLATMKYAENDDVVALLTDLQHTWYIFWRDGFTIFHYRFESSNDAVGFLEHHLEFDSNLRANPSMTLEPDRLTGLDVLWSGKRQKRLLGVQEHQEHQEHQDQPPLGRLSELKGLLGLEEEAYFEAHRLICEVQNLPEFWNLSRRELLGLESSGSGYEPPPPFMYI